MAWPGDPAISASKSAAPSSEPPTATWRKAGAAYRRGTRRKVLDEDPWPDVLAESSRSQPQSSRWLTGARAAPSRPAANSDSRNAGWLGPSHATRSPLATPSVRRPLASRRGPGRPVPRTSPSGLRRSGPHRRGPPWPGARPTSQCRHFPQPCSQSCRSPTSAAPGRWPRHRLPHGHSTSRHLGQDVVKQDYGWSKVQRRRQGLFNRAGAVNPRPGAHP